MVLFCPCFEDLVFVLFQCVADDYTVHFAVQYHSARRGICAGKRSRRATTTMIMRPPPPPEQEDPIALVPFVTRNSRERDYYIKEE